MSTLDWINNAITQAQATGVALAGPELVWLLLALILASYISEDLTCIAAGLLIANGVISFPAGLAACLLGLLSGDIALFYAGRWLAQPMLRRWIKPDKLASATSWLSTRGPWVIVVSRFTPGTRLPTYVAAGALRMPPLRFIAYFAFATALWTPLLIGIAMLFGEVANQWFAQYRASALWYLIALTLITYVAVRLVMNLLTWRGRRLAYSWLQRLLRFEFWPRSAFYPPIILYCIYLALRHRSATLFTLANPAIELGGLVGESKHAILEGLSGAHEFVADYTLIPSGPVERRQGALEKFMAAHELDYPLVLKPDKGERGSGVRIVSSRQAAAAYLQEHDDELIAQRYIAGREFGVFYIRHPDAERGYIFSITDKQPPSLVGDGVSTLETLILNDERAVLMARFFLASHAQQLDRVLADGEQFKLTELGTHSRGCVFLDGAWLQTEALSQRIDEISRSFDGFFFGRYDIRTPSVEAMQAGREFFIVELNGVSSEATHIYDPSNNLLSAWRTTARQWRIAFEIGAANRQRGHKSASVGEVVRALRG